MSELDKLKARVAQLEAVLLAKRPKNQGPDLLTVAEAAAFLDMTKSTLNAYRTPGHQQGRNLSFVKAADGRIAYKREVLEAFKATRANGMVK